MWAEPRRIWAGALFPLGFTRLRSALPRLCSFPPPGGRAAASPAHALLVLLHLAVYLVFSLPSVQSCIRVVPFPIVSDYRPRTVQILGLLLLLVQANKVFFLSFFFFLTVLTGEINSPGLPVGRTAWAGGRLCPGGAVGKGARAAGPVLRGRRGGAGGRVGAAGLRLGRSGPVGASPILSSIWTTCFRGLSPRPRRCSGSRILSPGLFQTTTSRIP